MAANKPRQLTASHKEPELKISIELPDEIADQIVGRWGDLSRRALESLVADAYRENVISGPQAQEILGFQSLFELDAFLQKWKVYLDYAEDDLEADARALDELVSKDCPPDPRQPGALAGEMVISDELDQLPEDLVESFGIRND